MIAILACSAPAATPAKDQPKAGAPAPAPAASPAAAPAAKPAASPAAAPAAAPAASPAAAPAAKPAASPAAAPAAPAASPAASAADVDRWYAAAKQEGRLSIYTTIIVDTLEPMIEKFKARYPGIEVDYVRTNDAPLIQRLISEARAGQHLADVVETGDFAVYELEKEGLLKPFTVPESASQPADLKRPDNMWVGTYIIPTGISWNTDLVKDPPKDYDELLDSRFKGRLTVDPTDSDIVTTLAIHRFKTEEATKKWIDGIAAQQPKLQTGHNDTAQLMAAGGVAVYGTSFLTFVEPLKQQGKPVAYSLTEGVIKAQVQVIMDKAPHPNAALLFTNWLIGKEGQEYFRDKGLLPASTAVQSDIKYMPERRYYTSLEVVKERPKYDKMWRQALGVR
jgi:iron(III) transport system substrate-binding protein